MNAPPLPPDFPAHLTPPQSIDGHPIRLVQFYRGIARPEIPEGRWAWFKWAFFGNALDGPIGDPHWNPQRKDSWWIRVKWWCRNPAHNWCWHVKGFAHEDTVRYDAQTDDRDGWNHSWTERVNEPGKHYPFRRYLGHRVEYYKGWRGRGAWGMKLKRRSR